MTRSSLTRQIFIAMVLGVVGGGAVNVLAELPATRDSVQALLQFGVNGALHVVGQAFLRLLQVLVVPLVLTALIAGVAGLDDVRKLGRIGFKMLGLYTMTTVTAVTFAVVVALTLEPGAGVLLGNAEFLPREGQSVTDVLINLVPRNVIGAMANGEMIPVIVFAILFGIGITLAGEPGQRVRSVFEDFNTVVMKLVGIVMRLAPIGVFALVARTFANEGFDALLPLLRFVLLTLATLAVYAFLFYPVLLRILSGLNPWTLLRRIREVQLFAFSTASSSACIPLSLRKMRELGVSPSMASFSSSVGASISMDGTAIMQGMATVFIAQIYGVDLSIMQLATVVLTATLATMGTAGIPGAGTVMLSTVLLQVGLPLEGIALILGVDRILDMARTVVNVTVDFVIVSIVAKSEGLLDESMFNAETP